MAAPTTELTPEQLQALLNGPAGKPPAGVLPNFENPPNLDATIIAILTLCIFISTVAVFIRSYSKLFIVRSIAYEDCAILLAWVGLIGFTVPSVLDFKNGGGRHMWDIRLKSFFRVLYWVNITGILYGIIVFLIKWSILLQYQRIFVPNRKGSMVLFVAIQFLIWSIFIFYFVDTIFEIIMCSPREKIWNPLMTTGHCFKQNSAYLATGLFNVTSDIIILVLPIFPIWKLQMPLKRKLMVLSIFATGFIACVTSLLRTYYTFKIIDSPDVSYNIIVMGLWTWGEVTSGILVSCLPVTPKFFQHFGPKVHSAFSTGYKSGSKSHSIPFGNNSGPTDSKKTAGVPVQFERAFDKYSAGSVYSHQTHHKGEYITLDEFDESNLKANTNCEGPSMGGEGRATKREDLEMGSHSV